MSKYIIFVASMFVLGARVASAQVRFIVHERVFRIKIADQVGSAFTIDGDGRQYLITADHLFGDNCVKCNYELWLNDK